MRCTIYSYRLSILCEFSSSSANLFPRIGLSTIFALRFNTEPFYITTSNSRLTFSNRNKSNTR